MGTKIVSGIQFRAGGNMSGKGKVASVRVKDMNIFELTPGLAGALAESLDSSYLEYFTAACS